MERKRKSTGVEKLDARKRSQRLERRAVAGPATDDLLRSQSLSRCLHTK